MIYLAILMLVSLPVPVILAIFMFDDWREFLRAFRFIFTPDIFSIFWGEGMEDTWNSMKLYLMVIVWLLTAAGAHLMLGGVIAWIAELLGG